GAPVSRRRQPVEQIGGGQPDRDGEGGRQETQVLEIRRRDRARNAAARRESACPRATRSDADRRDSQAALKGQRSILALRQRSGAQRVRPAGPLLEGET